MDIGKIKGEIWHRNLSPGRSLLGTVVQKNQLDKVVHFLHVAFDTTGNSFLAGDHHGNIYAFDITKNRFFLVQRTGQACTALAFTCHRNTEFVVALADCTIKCFNKDTKQVYKWMCGHEGVVSSISVHSSGRYVITTSSDTALVWDLETFHRKRKLNIRLPIGIQKVFFLPHSNTILSCFCDDSIFAWENDTFCFKYQLPVQECRCRISYKEFAVTRDCKSLAVGGRSNILHIWCLDSQQLVKVIELPSQVRKIKQMDFLSHSFNDDARQTLGVLSQDGVMRFINIYSGKLIFHIGSVDEAITKVAIDPKGNHMVTIMDCGNINISIIQNIHQKAEVRLDTVQKPSMSLGRRKLLKILRSSATSSVTDKENELPACLSRKKLEALLKAFGEYPSKHRLFVWQSLLCLPENHTAYQSLTDKGLHLAFLTLHDKYPISSHKLLRGLQRVLSALAHWAAIFAEVDYLPRLAFPFVKLFQNNSLLCFEMVATVIVNWCQHWLEYFPKLPLNILSMAENVLGHHDQDLLQHLVDCGITSQLYVWPLLETMFSEVLTCDAWLRLFDNVFSNHPSFLLLCCVAYVLCCRESLLRCIHKKDFEFFFHNQSNLKIEVLIKNAYQLMDGTPAEIHPRLLLSDFAPLTSSRLYPTFNHYPKFLLEYHQSRERIQNQEMDYLKESGKRPRL